MEKRDLLRMVSRKMRVRSECSVGCCNCVHELRTHTHTHTHAYARTGTHAHTHTHTYTPWVTPPPHPSTERERKRDYQKVQGEGAKVDVRLLNIGVSYLSDALSILLFHRPVTTLVPLSGMFHWVGSCACNTVS